MAPTNSSHTSLTGQLPGIINEQLRHVGGASDKKGTNKRAEKSQIGK